MLTFRQEGDMGRYVADNDPGGIAEGFSNLEDFLAAGNKIPEYKMGGRQPLQAVDAQQGPFDLSKINKNPYGTEFVGIGEDQTNLFGYRVPDEIIKAQEESAKNNPINMFNVSLPGELGTELTPLNPVPGAQQATPSTPNTESFSQILPPSNNFLDDTRDKTLPQISDPAGLRKAIRTVNPIVSGPEEFAIASNQQIPDAGLFNRVGQQLMGYDDQFSGINDRLNKIEEGIASLVQNRGQGLNMNTGGLGYFFNPFGGFYG